MHGAATELMEEAGLSSQSPFNAKIITWQPDNGQPFHKLSQEALPGIIQETGALYTAPRETGGLMLMVFNPFPAAAVRNARCWLWLRGLMELLPPGQVAVSGEIRRIEELPSALARMAPMSDWWNESSDIQPAQARDHRKRLQTGLKKSQFNYLPGYVSRMVNTQPMTVGEAWSFVPLLLEAVWAQFPQMPLAALVEGLDSRELGIHPNEALIAWSSALGQTLKADAAELAAAPIDRVIAGIQTDCSLPYSQTNLAQSLGLTPAYFCRLFREKTGAHFSQYLTQVRMERAKELLAQPGDLNLGETAQLCGYPHKSYFCQVFKKYTGMSPGEYHQIHK